MNITNIKEGYNNLTFVLTERFTTAIDTYNLMLKLNTEQETSGEFNVLCEDLYREMAQHNLTLHLQPQFFKGNEDVIFELLVCVSMNTDCKLDNKDLVKEYILGSILGKIKKHFDFYYGNHNSDIEVIKFYFRNY